MSTVAFGPGLVSAGLQMLLQVFQVALATAATARPLIGAGTADALHPES